MYKNGVLTESTREREAEEQQYIDIILFLKRKFRLNSGCGNKKCKCYPTTTPGFA